MLYEKLVSTINSVAEVLEDSKDVDTENEKQLERLVWKVSAELEYALFLFSVLHSDKLKAPKKVNLKTSPSDAKATLALVQNLINEIKEDLRRKEELEAHRKTWVVREYLFKVKGEMEKRLKQEKSK